MRYKRLAGAEHVSISCREETHLDVADAIIRETLFKTITLRKKTGTYLKIFSCLEERGEGFLGHVYLSTIHEFEEGRHIVGARPGENNDQPRGRGWYSFEELLKVFAACC